MKFSTLLSPNRTWIVRLKSHASKKRGCNSSGLANSNGSGVKTVFLPAVAGSVATAAPKMEFCQKEELIGHHTIRIGDGDCRGSPINRHTASLVNKIWMVAAGGLEFVVWHKSKEAVRICIAVTELYCTSVGFKALGSSPSRLCRWDDSKEKVIAHVVVLWFCVTGVTIH